MSNVNNIVYIPSYGKDKTKFKSIPAFSGVTKAPMFRKVASGFRMAGKVRDFVMAHKLAVHYYGSNFNGYGYATSNYEYLMSRKDAATLLEMLHKRNEAAKKRKRLTFEERTAAWCRQLVRLTGISMDDAQRIAEEKLEAHAKKINELEERQLKECYSVMRKKLIDKMCRENPLRRIKDANHAFAILGASVRHNESNYDDMLDEAREKAAMGEIDYCEIQSYARQHARYWGDIQSAFFSNEEDNEEEEDTNEDGEADEVEE
jgi:hypothetical protein